MRIAIITGEYPPMEGGVGDFTHELSLELAAQDHEVHILTTGTKTQPEEEPPLTVHRLIPEWGWGTQKRLNQWVAELKPDIVNIQYQSAAYQMKGQINLYPRRRKATSPPVVVTYHDLMPPYLFPKAGPLRQWAVLQLAQHSQGLIITNSPDYIQLTETKPQDDLPPIRLIPIGSNINANPPEDYDRNIWRASIGIGPNDLLVGFFGFLNHSKGIETLLEAIAKLVEMGLPAHLLFIGGRTGSSDYTNIAYANEIDALIEQLGIAQRIHRTGFARPEVISAAMLGCDLCALPYRAGANLRRGTLHASLAHGKAIVTTLPDGESQHLVDGKNVLFVAREDSEALAGAIRRLWEEPELRARLEKEAAGLAREFTWDRIALRTGQFFKELVRR